MPGDGRRRDLLRDPAEDARARDAVAEAELDMCAVRADLAQAPAAALVQAGHARPGHVAWLVPFDHLDQAADLSRADPHQHPVAGAAAALLIAADLPARHAAEQVQ